MKTASFDTLRPPRQRRSERTLQRIVEAARVLLEERSFETVSVTDIVRRAGSSVGSFYARFPEKRALLEYLRRAFEDETAEQIRDVLAAGRKEGTAFEELVRDFVRVLVRQHRIHRGALRALLGQSVAGDGAAGTAWEWISPLFLDELVGRWRREIGHPEPEVAGRVVLAMVLGAVRERVLFEEPSRCDRPVTDALFAEELARAVVGLLDVNTPGRPG